MFRRRSPAPTPAPAVRPVHDPCPTAAALAAALAAGELIPLDMLGPGQGGRVFEVLGAPHAVHRLEELGLGIGSAVRVLRQGPPSLLALGGQRLCFRPEPGITVLVDTAAAVA